jgi:hypothetical protein
MADFGLSKGLTFKVPASEYVNREIEDMKYADRMAREQEAVNMARSQLLYGDIEIPLGSNPVDNAIIQQKGRDLITQIGSIAADKNFFSNYDSLGKVQLLKQQYKTDDAVVRSAVHKNSMENYAKWKQEASKNPTRYRMDEAAEFENEMNNYDGSKPLVFKAPREVADLSGIEIAAAAKMDPDHYERWNNGNKGAFIGRVSDKNLYAQAQSLYANNQSDYDYVYKDEKDKVGAIARRLASETKTDQHFGEVDKLREAKELELFKARLKQGMDAQKTGGSLYDTAYLKTASIAPGAQELEKVFTSTPPAYYINANGKKVQVTSDDPFKFSGTMTDQGVKFNENGDAVGGSITGVKIAPGYINKNLEWAEDNGYVSNPFGPSGQGNTDFEVKPEHKGKGEIAFDKDNKPYFKLYATAVIDGNSEVYKNRVDKGLAPSIKEGFGGQANTMSQPATREIRVNKNTGKRYMQTSGGWQEIN